MEELKPGLRRHWVNGQKGMLAQIYFDISSVRSPKASNPTIRESSDI